VLPAAGALVMSPTAARAAAIAGGGAGVGRQQALGVRLPAIALRVEPLEEAVGAVDPRPVAVGEGHPVVELQPGEQAVSGVLQGVAVGRERLVVEAIANVGRVQVVQGLEAEDVPAGRRGLGEGRGGRHQHAQQDTDGDQATTHGYSLVVIVPSTHWRPVFSRARGVWRRHTPRTAPS